MFLRTPSDSLRVAAVSLGEPLFLAKISTSVLVFFLYVFLLQFAWLRRRLNSRAFFC